MDCSVFTISIFSQASHDPPCTRKGQVKSNTLTCPRGMQLCTVECNYCAASLASTSGIVSGRDVIAVLPTGFGKSLCYVCLPTVFNLVLLFEGPSIVLVIGHSSR